jgi:hypothetical protein
MATSSCSHWSLGSRGERWLRSPRLVQGDWAKDSQAMRKVYVLQARKHASRGPLRALDEASQESKSRLVLVQALKVAAAVRDKVIRG